ncbi:MAG TPA: polysaccharide deacetylase family protein [Streptosporangiaceae bacterium]|nr:polysaccharide deacetylase family protein [Streptosporangiaceae bacterium]
MFSDSAGPRAPAALAVAALALGGLAVSHAGPGVTALGPLRRRFFPRLAGQGGADHVALTFDDGPDPAWTPAFLEVLAKWQVHATFFMLGSMAAREPGLAAEVAGAGHEVAVHGWEHRYTVLRSPWAVADDLARARDAVAGATGAQPRFYRPPYGVLSTGALTAARGLGLTPVLWTCWGREWTAGATPHSVWATLAGNLTGGATVLLHDSDCTSPPGSAAAGLGALPRLLEECALRNLVAGRLAEHSLVS